MKKLISRLGKHTIRKDGQEYVFNCPKCKHFKFEVNFEKKLFHCFAGRCKWGGHLSGLYEFLVMAPEFTHDEYSRGFRVIEIKKPQPDMTGWSPMKPLTGAHPIKYLVSRGLTATRIIEMKISMGTEFKYRNRIMIPIIEEGKIVAYCARAFDGTEPKELFLGNAAKGEYLYNLDAVGDQSTIIMTEGIFDAEAVIKAGYESTVALLGSTISPIQVGKILAKHPSHIIAFLDNDEAGKDGNLIIYKRLLGRYQGKLSVVDWSKFNHKEKDPGECLPTDIQSLLSACITGPDLL